MLISLPRPFTFVGILLLLCGCGTDAPRVRVFGEVTYEGKPVPYGNVTFEPDISKGNKGPQGYAAIKDGKYDSDQAGTQASPGPQKVQIVGYPELTGVPASKTMLVIDYHTTVDLPARATPQDFVVPTTAVRRELVIQQPPP